MATEAKVWRWNGRSGGLGLGLASYVRGQVEPEKVGDKVHHWGIHAQRKHVPLALLNGEQVSLVWSEKWREIHILWCPVDLAKWCWVAAVDKLKDWLQKAKTDPQLVEAIVGRLQGWYLGVDLHSASKWLAFIQQCSLGWNTLLEGGLLRLLRQEQDNFWKSVKPESQANDGCWN